MKYGPPVVIDRRYLNADGVALIAREVVWPVAARAGPAHDWPRKPRPRMTLGHVIEHVAWEFDIAPAAIDAGRRGFIHKVARLAFVWLARRHTGASGADLAGQLRCHVMSITSWHRQARLLFADDAWVRERFEQLDAALHALSCALPVESAA